MAAWGLNPAYSCILFALHNRFKKKKNWEGAGGGEYNILKPWDSTQKPRFMLLKTPGYLAILVLNLTCKLANANW